MLRNDIRPSLHDVLENVSRIGSLIYELHQLDKKLFSSENMKSETTMRYNGAFSLLDSNMPSEALKHITDYFDETPSEPVTGNEVNLLLDLLRKSRLQFSDVASDEIITEGRYTALARLVYISWEGDERVFGYQLYDNIGKIKVAVTVGRMVELTMEKGCRNAEIMQEENAQFYQVQITEDIPRIETSEAAIRELVNAALFQDDTYYTFDMTTLLRVGCLKRLYLSVK